MCEEECLSELLRATRILDFKHRDALYQVYSEMAKQQGKHFPISINNPANGFITCPLCHSLFSGREKHISFGGDGVLHFSAAALRNDKYQRLKEIGAKVTFAHQIGQKDYPTAAFIDWAVRLQKEPESKKRKRG